MSKDPHSRQGAGGRTMAVTHPALRPDNRGKSRMTHLMAGNDISLQEHLRAPFGGGESFGAANDPYLCQGGRK